MKNMTSMQLAFKSAGVRVRRTTKSWPRAKGAVSVDCTKQTVKNVHYVVNS